MSGRAVRQLERFLAQAGAVPSAPDYTDRVFEHGYQAGLDAAEEKLRTMARAWPAAGSHALRVGADAIRAMAKEGVNGC